MNLKRNLTPNKNLYGFYEIDFSGFILTAKHRFNLHSYPEYKHAKTKDISSSAPVIGRNKSLEYVFTKAKTKEDIKSYESGYFSGDIASDSESDSYYEDLSDGCQPIISQEPPCKRIRLK